MSKAVVQRETIRNYGALTIEGRAPDRDLRHISFFRKGIRFGADGLRHPGQWANHRERTHA